MEEWKKPLYGPILGRKVVYIPHGGTCMKMRNNEEVLEIEGLQHLQCQHEEADTLLAFHANIISNGNIPPIQMSSSWAFWKVRRDDYYPGLTTGDTLL